MTGRRGGDAIAEIAAAVLYLQRVHDVAGIGDHITQIGGKVAPPLQVVQRRILAQAEHDLGVVIGFIAAIEAVKAAFHAAPAVAGRPGIALAIGLYRPGFAVNQPEPVAVFDLQPALDIGAIAVSMFVLAF